MPAAQNSVRQPQLCGYVSVYLWFNDECTYNDDKPDGGCMSDHQQNVTRFGLNWSADKIAGNKIAGNKPHVTPALQATTLDWSFLVDHAKQLKRQGQASQLPPRVDSDWPYANPIAADDPAGTCPITCPDRLCYYTSVLTPAPGCVWPHGLNRAPVNCGRPATIASVTAIAHGKHRDVNQLLQGAGGAHTSQPNLGTSAQSLLLQTAADSKAGCICTASLVFWRPRH